MVAKGDAKTGGMLVRSLDKLRRAVGIKNSPSAGDIAMLERLVMNAIGNRTATRSGDGVQYANAQGIVYDYSQSFEQQVEDYKNGKIDKMDTLLVCKTPEVFLQVGLNPLPMTINTTHVDYAINGTKDADHFLGEAQLKQLPEKLQTPIAIFVSKSKGKTSIIALLDFQTNGKQTIVPVVVDGFGFQNQIRIDRMRSQAFMEKTVQRNSCLMLLLMNKMEILRCSIQTKKKPHRFFRAPDTNCPGG